MPIPLPIPRTARRLAPYVAALVASTGVALGVLATGPASAGESAKRTPCSLPTDQTAGTTAKYTIDSGGLEREYTLHLPADYAAADNWPLIIAFHGRGSTGTEVEGFSSLSTLPAVVAYPDGAIGTGSGYRQAWQGAPYEPVGVDDVAFTSALIDQLQADFCLDAARIYATGKSNGAGLAALLACRLPERIAAVAVVAPALYPGATEGCDAAPAKPVLEIHGTGDTTIPYAGDADRGLPAIPDWVSGWAAHDGCVGQPKVTGLGEEITTTTWQNCADGAEVQHVAVRGGGHVWPGAEVYSGGGYVTQAIEAHRVAWRFLSRHTLNEGAL